MESGQDATAGERKTTFSNPTLGSICCDSDSETNPSILVAYFMGNEDYYYFFTFKTMVYSLILVCICTPLFFWVPLVCVIPAISNAKKAQQLHTEGNVDEAERKGNLAKKLGIATFVSTLCTVSAGVGVLVFLVGLFKILGYY